MSVPVSPHAPAAPAHGPLRQRSDAELPGRLARSLRTVSGAQFTVAEFHAWFAARLDAGSYRVTRCPLAGLPGWSFEPGSGDLVHRSGRFFSVEGVHVRSESGPVGEWHQPIINQPEVGIIGILVKEFDGVLHFLMQAKMEPGNLNVLQLSPTVQATRSNFTKVHGGADVKYLQYFAHVAEGRHRGRVLADSLQSEHGAWFLRKSNRNMIVETFEDVELHDSFLWLTLGQIGELLHHDNLVNMDSRTVLSCLPMEVVGGAGRSPLGQSAFAASVDRSWEPAAGALHSDVAVLSWLTSERARRDLVTRSVPLAQLPGWEQSEYALSHHAGRHFDVVGVHVEAGSREVGSWSQPLIEPHGVGINALLVKRVDGVLHVLVQALAEAGSHDAAQIAPTAQCTPANYDWLPAELRPAYFDLVRTPNPASVRYEAVHSEEGGRFLNAANRYQIIEVPEDFATEEPPNHRWLTMSQLAMLIRHGNSVNVQARTLLVCLTLCCHEPGRPTGDHPGNASARPG